MIQKINVFFEGRKVLKIIGMVIGGIFLAALLSFLVGWLVMLLWNWLMPAIFGLGTITYWQGFGIFFLAKLIFGFSGGHDDSSSKKKSRKKTIKGEIGKEIKKEFEKECEKEFEKSFTKAYDDKYEQWWKNEGEAAFEKFMNKSNGTEEATEGSTAE